ncbi:hypothetical protein CCACVL1_29524 [Corchorus capsularis]|uniref:Aminotransferase-like plant mobile domain-containing protein n=1 Tax=Corchorus capsularis TaxID=210143 RepID=A0A1R3G1C4_COCAP|nr:hypothetical protein CCACVL1_29524 [Corchorus capsularis]
MVKTMGLESAKRKKTHVRPKVAAEPAHKKQKTSPLVVQIPGDRLWQNLTRTFLNHPKVANGANLLGLSHEPETPDQTAHIPADTVMKFTLERGVMPPSKVRFFGIRDIPNWNEWVADIMGDDAHRNKLISAGIYDAVRASTKLLYIEVKSDQACGKPRSFKSWVDQCRDDEDLDLQRHQLVCFLLTWLARYVLPGNPEKGISQALIPLAIRLSRGLLLPLGPLYLGSLYAHLDLLHEKMKASMGVYEVMAYLDIPFIQMCLWERFPSAAPTCKQCPPSSVDSRFRAWAWYNCKAKTLILSLMDKWKEFEPRPYVRLLGGYGDPSKYPTQSGAPSVDMRPWAFAHELPAVIESDKFARDFSFSTVLYAPSRVAVQFGFDQLVPSKYEANHGFLQILSSFGVTYMEGISRHLPSVTRKGVYSNKWKLFYGECFTSWNEYAKYDPLLREDWVAEEISTNDLSLRKVTTQEKSQKKSKGKQQKKQQQKKKAPARDHINTGGNASAHNATLSRKNVSSHDNDVLSIEAANILPSTIAVSPPREIVEVTDDIIDVENDNVISEENGEPDGDEEPDSNEEPDSSSDDEDGGAEQEEGNEEGGSDEDHGSHCGSGSDEEGSEAGSGEEESDAESEVDIEPEIHAPDSDARQSDVRLTSSSQGAGRGTSATPATPHASPPPTSSVTGVVSTESGFHGFPVKSMYLAPLKEAELKGGKFWESTFLESDIVIAGLLDQLGDFILKANVPSNLSVEELESMRKTYDDLVKIKFNLDFMESTRTQLEKIIGALKFDPEAELATVNKEMADIDAREKQLKASLLKLERHKHSISARQRHYASLCDFLNTFRQGGNFFP